jgi:Uma2 family endonuclease
VMNSQQVSEHKFSYREYQYFPDDGKRHEIIDGDHFMSPAPSTKHQTVSIHLPYLLFTQIVLTKRGLVFNAPYDVELAIHDIVQPDLIVVMNDDRRDVVTPKRISGVPSLCIEILSESNPAHDRVLKFEMYQRCKLPEYWSVDPEVEQLEQWSLDSNATYQRLGAWTESFSASTISEIEIDLRAVWESA